MNGLSSRGQACTQVLTDWEHFCPGLPKTDAYRPPGGIDRLGLSRSNILLLHLQSSRTLHTLHYTGVFMLEQNENQVLLLTPPFTSHVNLSQQNWGCGIMTEKPEATATFEESSTCLWVPWLFPRPSNQISREGLRICIFNEHPKWFLGSHGKCSINGSFIKL